MTRPMTMTDVRTCTVALAQRRLTLCKSLRERRATSGKTSLLRPSGWSKKRETVRVHMKLFPLVTVEDGEKSTNPGEVGGPAGLYWFLSEP